MRLADVDLSQFSPTTIELLNLVTRIHAEGLTPANIRDWLQKAQSPELVDQLWRDLLTLRNEHLLQEIGRALDRTDAVIVPWGAAHMPGLAQGLDPLGFKLARQQEYQVIRFSTVLKAQRTGRARNHIGNN